jgi:hypothetical protein
LKYAPMIRYKSLINSFCHMQAHDAIKTMKVHHHFPPLAMHSSIKVLGLCRSGVLQRLHLSRPSVSHSTSLRHCEPTTCQPHSSPCPNRSRRMSPRSLTIWSLPVQWWSMSAQPRATSRAHSSLPCARGKMRAQSWRIRLGMVCKSRRRTLGGTRQWPSGAGTVWSRL